MIQLSWLKLGKSLKNQKKRGRIPKLAAKERYSMTKNFPVKLMEFNHNLYFHRFEVYRFSARIVRSEWSGLAGGSYLRDFSREFYTQYNVYCIRSSWFFIQFQVMVEIDHEKKTHLNRGKLFSDYRYCFQRICFNARGN